MSEGPRAPWDERKAAYLVTLADEPVEVLEVSVADKLHNARSLLVDYAETGPATWERFNESRPEYQLWYYAAVTSLFSERLPDHPLAAELATVLTELRDVVRADVPDIDERVDAAWADMAGRGDR